MILSNSDLNLIKCSVLLHEQTEFFLLVRLGGANLLVMFSKLPASTADLITGKRRKQKRSYSSDDVHPIFEEEKSNGQKKIA